METTFNEVVTLTPNAVKAVKGMIARKNLGVSALRLSVEKGGCSGMSYAMKFDTETTVDDLASEVDGLRVWVDRESATYLQGMSLDFSDDLVGGGFKFLNPNAKKTCGCGESFSA
jgi:iron-sulfur cluster assembly protein